MGLEEEYEACREHVWKVDFRLIGGNDWARGWRADLPRDGDERRSEEEDLNRRDYLDEYAYGDERERQGRQSHQLMGTFETGIRYLGGLVGAYDLSGDEIVLERAKELGKVLGRGFDTTSGLLLPRFDAGSRSEWFHNGRVSLAEVGSMTLELTRLSQVTGDRWYFDRAQRAIDYIQHVIVPTSSLAPLVPAMFDSHPTKGHALNGYYTFGAMADSYYEYLIKQHQLIGGATDQFAEMYADAVDKAQEVLYADLPFYEGRGMMTISGRHHPGRGLGYDLEHLSCFAGGMLGLGAKLLDRPADLDVGQAFTRTCYHLGASTPSGLQPEIVNFLRPDLPEGSFYENITAVVEDGEDEYITVNKLKGTPQGTSGADGRYLGRPETAESVFYMWVERSAWRDCADLLRRYRLTGDPKWQVGCRRATLCIETHHDA
jgi:mannosyl-oligosaccharide alpha-1,2-mannosidase